jgi:hypothetical protein
MERCPLARYGLGSDLFPLCPGFDPLEVTLGHGPGAGVQGTTCCHIGSGTTGRGAAAICLHPEAPRVVKVARQVATMIPASRDRHGFGDVLGRMLRGRPAHPPRGPAT